MIDIECPHRCNTENKILDRSLGRMVPCPHCKEIATEEVQESPELSFKLGFTHAMHMSNEIDFEGIMPKSEKPFIDVDSFNQFKEDCLELWGKLSQGEIPDRSYCLCMGMKGIVPNLAYPLMTTAYGSGMTVHPLVSANEISWWKMKGNIENLVELREAQIAVILLEEGIARAGLNVAKGIMQERALRDKPTIFITTWTLNSVAILISNDESSGHYLAKPCHINYRNSNKEKYSNYVNGILGVENTIG